MSSRHDGTDGTGAAVTALRLGQPTGPVLLRVDASARRTGSATRALTDRLVEGLCRTDPALAVVTRDLAAEAMAFVDETWTRATGTPPDARTDAQRRTLARSDALVAELKAATLLVIGCPVYNFTVPAALKAWIDQVCRARLTFSYSETGPKGLLEGKRAYVVLASGGTAAGGAVDFTTPYLRHILGFVGITDVAFVNADRLMVEGEAKLETARAEIDRLVAADAARRLDPNALASPA